MYMDNNCCICYEKKNILTQLIHQPCNIKSHRICKNCLTKMVKMMPINENKPVLKCMYPFADCDSKKSYRDEMIAKILKDRFFIYKEAKERYTFPDHHIRTCGTCSSVCLIDKTRVNILYSSIYTCSSCYNMSCFTCEKNIPYGLACNNCYLYNFYNNPLNYNYFFYKSKTRRLYLTDYKYKNEELDYKFIVNFITKKFQDEDVYTSCPVCDIRIEKSEDCNAVFHCHVEICNSCGMFSNIGEKLYDHWSARGFKGCPRWDGDPCIKNDVKNFICKEKECYGHIQGNCDKKEHRKGVLEYKTYKKKKLMYHYLINIPRIIRNDVIDNLPVALTKYLPGDGDMFEFDMKSSDANEYKHF